MALFESAKHSLGIDRVQNICESLVQVYFFRGTLATGGKQWMDSLQWRDDLLVRPPKNQLVNHTETALRDKLGKVCVHLMEYLLMSDCPYRRLLLWRMEG